MKSERGYLGHQLIGHVLTSVIKIGQRGFVVVAVISFPVVIELELTQGQSHSPDGVVDFSVKFIAANGRNLKSSRHKTNTGTHRQQERDRESFRVFIIIQYANIISILCRWIIFFPPHFHPYITRRVTIRSQSGRNPFEVSFEVVREGGQ